MTDPVLYKLPRLYVENQPLSVGQNLVFPDRQAHYLRNVMRLLQGDQLRLFNGVDGDWLCVLSEVSKKNVLATVVQQIKEQISMRGVDVLAAPVKKEAFDWMVEKASELGVVRFYPVQTERTVVHRLNPERLHAIAVEAAEQCERQDVMRVDALMGLKDLLNSWDKDKNIILCIERRNARVLGEVIRGMPKDTSETLAVLVGPEGGFSQGEIDYLLSLPFVIPVTLGARILRAETALVSVLAILQCSGLRAS